MDVLISDKRISINDNQKISNGFTKTGNVFLLNDTEVIKIFRYVHPQFNEQLKNKLEILHRLKLKKFVLPTTLVYDENGNVIGYTMKYIKGENGDAILKYSSKFLLEELEKIYEEVSILSQNNIVIDDLIVDNVIVNEHGIFFIDVDDYILRARANYESNMKDSNFEINVMLKEIFARMFSYKKNVLINEMFDSFEYFSLQASGYYKQNQTVKDLVKLMISDVKTGFFLKKAKKE